MQSSEVAKCHPVRRQLRQRERDDSDKESRRRTEHFTDAAWKQAALGNRPGGSPMYKQLNALLGFLAGLLIAFAIAAVMNGGL